jgi:hypothetical protein
MGAGFGTLPPPLFASIVQSKGDHSPCPSFNDVIPANVRMPALSEGGRVGHASIRAASSGCFSSATGTPAGTWRSAATEVTLFAWLALDDGRFAKPLYGVKSVSGVRIPVSPLIPGNPLEYRGLPGFSSPFKPFPSDTRPGQSWPSTGTRDPGPVPVRSRCNRCLRYCFGQIWQDAWGRGSRR